jgi:hypothetical protein
MTCDWNDFEKSFQREGRGGAKDNHNLNEKGSKGAKNPPRTAHKRCYWIPTVGNNIGA